jgi:hypothetical protein
MCADVVVWSRSWSADVLTGVRACVRAARYGSAFLTQLTLLPEILNLQFRFHFQKLRRPAAICRPCQILLVR